MLLEKSFATLNMVVTPFRYGLAATYADSAGHPICQI